jgi:hypothetical protein
VPQRVDVVHHLEEAAARRTVIERLPDLVVAGTPGGTAENCLVSTHRRIALWCGHRVPGLAIGWFAALFLDRRSGGQEILIALPPHLV